MFAPAFSRRSVFAVLASLALVAAVGCKSDGSMAASSDKPMTMSKGVLVTSKTGSVVYVPTANGSVQVMSTSGAPMCEDCKMAAAHYFQTGDLTPNCPKCNGARVPVVAMP